MEQEYKLADLKLIGLVNQFLTYSNTDKYDQEERDELGAVFSRALGLLNMKQFVLDIEYLVNTGFRVLQKYRDDSVPSCDKATRERIKLFAENSHEDLMNGLRGDNPEDFVDCWLYNWHVATDDPDAQITGYGAEWRASYSQAWVKHNLASG